MITNFQSILVCFEGAVVGSNLSQLPEIPFGKLLCMYALSTWIRVRVGRRHGFRLAQAQK
jgi:hypothetical protein